MHWYIDCLSFCHIFKNYKIFTESQSHFYWILLDFVRYRQVVFIVLFFGYLELRYTHFLDLSKFVLFQCLWICHFNNFSICVYMHKKLVWFRRIHMYTSERKIMCVRPQGISALGVLFHIKISFLLDQAIQQSQRERSGWLNQV